MHTGYTDDGKRIILKENKQWEYVPEIDPNLSGEIITFIDMNYKVYDTEIRVLAEGINVSGENLGSVTFYAQSLDSEGFPLQVKENGLLQNFKRMAYRKGKKFSVFDTIHLSNPSESSQVSSVKTIFDHVFY